MANIVPKLNLNRTPSIITNNSMVFAKNIRIDIDNTIHKDYSIESLQNTGNIFHNNLLTRIIADFKTLNNDIANYYLKCIYEISKNPSNKDYSLIKVIPDNKSFYILLRIGTGSKSKDIIVKFNEEDDLFYPCNCNWSYNDGNVTGSVINNLLGETILVIAEKNDNKNVPLKCINLSKSSYKDDESVYTQTPKIPITNLIYTGDFKFSIPNGVYQFFIRYKIRDNFYTNWFPASRELFAGNKHTTPTIFGVLGYHISDINSDNSFIFAIQHLISNNTNNFESFQIGFIISNDGAIKGRAWKHFSFDTTQINFDYKATEAEEIDVTDFTKPIFNVYNVGNVCSFKNKLYISNYKETNFNQELQTYADDVKIKILNKKQDITTGDNTKLYKDNICVLNDNNDIKGLNLPYAGEQSLNSIIQSNIVDFFFNSIKAKNKYNKKEECKYHIGSNISDVNTGIYVTIKRETFNINKPSKIILEEYTTNKLYDLTYNGETEQEQEESLKHSISLFSDIFIAYYNIGYINSNNFNFYSDGTDNSGNYFTQSTDLKPKDEEIGTVRILISNDNYNASNENTYDVITLYFSIESSLIVDNTIPIINNTTLIPYQVYRFYIHYVKESGEITNGYLIDEIEIENKENNCDKVIYPVFNNIKIPDGYSACFFSIAHVKNQTSVIYNIAQGNDSIFEGNCFELNTRLFNFNSEPTIHLINNTYDKDLVINGKYYNSVDTNYCRYFGAEGIIVMNKSSFNNDPVINNLSNQKLFIVNNYNNVDETNLELIKCTPYIKGETYTNYNNYNLLGYICSIYTLKRENTTNIYTDTSTIYKKEGGLTSISNLKFIEYNKYKEVDSSSNTNFIGNLNVADTKPTLIYSNFNLNYIELSESFKPKYVTYYNRSEFDTGNTDHKSETKFFNLFPSQSLSIIYKLDSTYYNYTRKTYNVYNKNDVYKFDNTIRSSKLAGDEDKLSIFEFDADDYYNIPINRGKIINLISVGDAILVHTRDSMFKFTGSNTLQSNTGEIQQTESDVFQTGVSEVFGSDFGFAGLQNKNAAIVTETGYIYYDGDSKIIYMYSGNGQIVKLSDSIEKLLRYDILDDVSFANDYYNNRFFTCLHFKSGDVTLSYSFNQESKSFISLHDFKFNKAFNTKTKCYFITSNNNICRIDKSSYGLYRHLNKNDKFYPYASKRINETFINTEGKIINISTNYFYSIIDVIENINYENVKTLNYINWSCAIINNEFPIFEDNTTHFNALTSSDEKYPCYRIKIYTDTCSTESLDCSNISNDKSIQDINLDPYYKYPRYNQGFWTLNYFRNILNADDKFKYLTQYNDDRTKLVYRSDNNSLIEGKYFVTRFTFDYDKDFKFETINFNYDTKL